jgi:hypothetical protein
LDSTAELREGTSYATGVDLKQRRNTIPPPREEPSDVVPNTAKDFVFDLETTGLGKL